MRKIEELTAPYKYLNWLVVIEELATLVLAIAAVATVHSIRERETHFAAIVGVIGLFFAHFATIGIYDNRTQQALSQLHFRFQIRSLDRSTSDSMLPVV